MESRPWNPNDVELLLQWAEADPAILRGFGVDSAIPEDVYMHAAAAIANPTTYWAGIWKDGDLAGLGILTDIQVSRAPRGAICHYIVAPEHRGRGFWVAREALRHVFEDIGIDMVQSYIPRDGEPWERVKKLDLLLGFEEVPVDMLRMNRQDWERAANTETDTNTADPESDSGGGGSSDSIQSQAG